MCYIPALMYYTGLLLSFLLVTGGYAAEKDGHPVFDCPDELVLFSRDGKLPQEVYTRKRAIQNKLGDIEQATFTSPESLVRRVVKAGFKTEKTTLLALGIPEAAHRFFDSTGAFKYVTAKPYELAVENGDSPFKYFRLVVRAEDLKKPRSLFDDYAAAIATLPDVTLHVSVTPFDPYHEPTLSKGQAAQLLLTKTAALTADQRQRVTLNVSNRPLHPWTTDDSKALKNGALVFPFATFHDEDRFEAAVLNNLRDLTEEKKFTLHRSVFSFDGGDILVGANDIFTGTMTVMSNRRLLRISEEEALSGLAAEFGKPVKLFDHRLANPQLLNYLMNTFPHVDLLATVARDRVKKDEVILLSSPKTALAALKAADLRNDPVGTEVLNALEKLKTVADAVDVYVEALAAQRRKEGYRVGYLPGFSYARRVVSGATGIQVVNYSNVHLGGDACIIAKLGSPALDAAAQKTYADLGYRMLESEAAAVLLNESNGGARCAANAGR